MTLRRLVTGAAGQDGQLLMSMFPKGTALGIDRAIPPGAIGPLEVCDITDAAHVRRVIHRFQPNEIFHLAALTSLAACEDDPALAYAVNAGGTANVLAAAEPHREHCRVLVVTSSEIFGEIGVNDRANETYRRAPVSVYGATKLAAEHLARFYREHRGMWVSTAIPFPHVTAESYRPHVLLRMAYAFARSEATGEALDWDMSNRNVVREWGHAGVYAQAMFTVLTELDEPVDVVLANGEGRTLGWAFEEMRAHFPAAVHPRISTTWGARPASPRRAVGDPRFAYQLGVLSEPLAGDPLAVRGIIADFANAARRRQQGNAA